MQDRPNGGGGFPTSFGTGPFASGRTTSLQSQVGDEGPRLHEPARRAGRPSAVRLLLTPTEAAEQLAVCRTKVYELMAAGILRSIQIGRLRRVPVEALHEFIEVGELR